MGRRTSNDEVKSEQRKTTPTELEQHRAHSQPEKLAANTELRTSQKARSCFGETEVEGLSSSDGLADHIID